MDVVKTGRNLQWHNTHICTSEKILPISLRLLNSLMLTLIILAAVNASCSGRWSGWSSGVACQSSLSSSGYFMILWTGLMSSEPMSSKLGLPLCSIMNRWQWSMWTEKIKTTGAYSVWYLNQVSIQSKKVKYLLLVIDFPVITKTRKHSHQ